MKLSLTKSRWVRFLALCIVLHSTPGAVEAVIDGVHYAVEGVSAHDPGHQEEHPDAEHCCTGLFHVCACHSHSYGFALNASWEFGNATLAISFPPFEDTLSPADFHNRLFRPPRS